MKLFGWKSAAKAPVRPALTKGMPWISGDWPRAYEVQLRELYLGCAIAQRAVRLVAEGVASIPFVARDAAAGQLVSATSGGQALLETLATQLLLHGNGYVQLLPDPEGRPVELFALRPERVSVEADAREIDGTIDALLKAASPIRQIASVVRVGSAGYRKLVTQNGVASGWASETQARPETATPIFNEVVPSFGDLYANPSATQAMLDDAAFDVEGWLAGEIAAEFAKAEGTAFVAGSGVNRPKGFLTGTPVITGDAGRAFGVLQYVPTGAAGAFATNPQDKLVDLVHTLRAPYRQGAVWVMNAATLATIRKFKTTDGAFLFQPGLAAGQPNTLLGYPVIEAEDMPDIAANSLSIAFGNFKAGYLIAERAETSVLRDPFTNKPFVNFYATKRVGGSVSNSEAIKLLKFSAS